MLQCYKCKYFEIRFADKTNKYGCKALGFKAADANWHWLHMPCPYFVENPKRNNNNTREENIRTKKLSNNDGIIDIIC